LLWEIDSSAEANLGFSFSAPVITKKADGTWVVLFTSGYNNTDPGDGKGYLYVRNALTGAHISRIGTGVGSLDTPSGLGKIATWADSPEKNNTAGYTYGGDLQGNLWRFDINTLDVLKFAVLKDPTGGTQPITARMELGSVGGKRIIYAGTGKYLEKSDLEDVQKQSLYAIKDDNATVTLDDARTSLVQQTVTASGATRTGSSVEVDFTTQRGWYIDFPDSGERVNVDMRLDSGTILTSTTVPSNTVCSPGGYGWLNYFNYLTGTAVVGAENNLVSQKFNAPIVGVNIFRLPNGKRITTVVTADNPTPEKPPKEIGGDKSDTGFVGKRIIWRELTP
jgi:type IV pilus assembly protein PilY1